MYHHKINLLSDFGVIPAVAPGNDQEGDDSKDASLILQNIKI